MNHRQRMMLRQRKQLEATIFNGEPLVCIQANRLLRKNGKRLNRYVGRR